MKYVFLSLVLILCGVWMACKTKPAPAQVTSAPASTIDTIAMNKGWSTVDSLEKLGLASSALTEVRKLKQMALEGNDSGHLVKAITYENKYLNQLEEDSSIKALSRLESEINTYPEPARSVMHSLAGQWYAQYLQGHLWELRSRTEFTGTPGPDIRTWGIRHLVDRIHDHFKKSVQWEGLKTVNVDDYPLLLTEKQNTDQLRPTLYDILIHRAIDFYSGTESYLTQPAYAYVLTDAKAFLPARLFVDQPFVTSDSLSNTWTALQWLQDLLAFRLSANNEEAALVDADLKRLRFVHEHIISDIKDSLYQVSLNELSEKHTGNPESALVDFYRAEFLIQKASEWHQDKNSKYRYAYNQAMDICRKAIEKFPDSYGAQLCKNLIAQIETKSVSAAIESVNLPGEALLAHVEYRNLSSIFMKVVKLPQAARRWKGENWDGVQTLDNLNKLTTVKSWEQKIDDGGDHQMHSTEIALDALPLGHYALVISDLQDFDTKRSTTGTILFTVSELGYWYIDTRDNSQMASVINRKTGQPIQGVKTEFYSYQYVSGRQRPTEIKLGEAISDAKGWVTLPQATNQSVFLRLTKDNDELFEEEGYHTYRNSRDYDANPTTLFFSDRAIYRPGQKIYFKGYALEFDKYRTPKIVTGKNVEVVLYDANGQEQMKKTFTSNSYGTFAGHFDLPTGGLTGQMSISSSHGASRHYFQVEEYKRPKFEVTYDSLKEVVRLDDHVTIRGFAKDYAGSAVPNAEVRFRVERVAYRPWWYDYYWKGYWPREEDRQVLVTGQTMTKADGSFDITFHAKPKAGGDPNLMYRFETTAFITDITGESHELTKSVVINKQGYNVNFILPEKISRQELRSILVTAENSDGGKVKINGELEVSSLKGPEVNKRNRFWGAPDILTISESEYASRFPSYYFPAKEDKSKWDVSSTIGKRAYTVDGTDSIDISDLFRQPGFYRLSWKWKDASGKELDMIQHVMVYDDNSKLPGHETIQVAYKNIPYQPGQTPEIDLLTGLASPPQSIKIVERRQEATTKTWMPLPNYNDQSIKITEDDRGGIYMHYLTVYNNRFIQSQHLIQVPWSNKDLQVELKTWRDKMEPGDDETWTITVKGSKQEAVSAEMLLSMYDASLDAFVPHQWQMNLYPSTYSKLTVQGSMTRTAYYWGLTHHWQEHFRDVPSRQYRDINVYGYYPEGGYGGYYVRRYKNGRDMNMMDGAVMLEAQTAAPPEASTTGNAAGKEESDESASEKKPPALPPTPPPLRTALEETVFFYPQVKTDEEGNLTFSFKMKEGLTRWKFQGLAHTTDLSFGLTQAEAVTQKELMVFPNPPRFFREGDTIAFQIKTTNLTKQSHTRQVM